MDPQQTHTENWHENVFFGIHYDLHAKAEDTELGRELTHEHLRERLTRIKPDWIQCDCKGHPGYTSWPTEVGSPSPGVVKDALRIHRDVTRELGIKLGMHYSGVIDSRALELHPEWGVVNAAGERTSRSTCRLSPYVDELMIPQILELIEKYDVDGFWVDGENWGSTPCWCEACRTAFTTATGIEDVPTSADQPHWSEWLAFQRQRFADYVTRYADAAHAQKRSCLICSNWMYTIRQPEPMTVPVDYLSGDYTPNWGAARAALEGRMLDNRGVTWDLMVWGFTRNYQIASSPWAMKPAVHLQQEVSEVVALGGAVMVYTKPHRTGWLTGWEHDIIADVADFCRDRKEVCFKSRSRSETAVLHLASHYYTCNDPLLNYGNAIQPIEGALNALLETHHSTDILTEDNVAERISQYKLLVLPEQTNLSEELTSILHDWIRTGGCLLASGSHLVDEAPGLVGCEARGKAEDRTIQLPVQNEAAQLSGTWQAVRPGPNTEAWVCGVRNLEPGLQLEDEVYVTCHHLGKGRVAAVHGPVFRNYFCAHFPRIRTLLDHIVNRLDVQWSVVMKGSPRVEMICREKHGALCVNLINRGAGETLSPQRTIIEELIPVRDITVKAKRDVKPKNVCLMPGKRPVPWTFDNGQLIVSVPQVDIHDIVVVE